MTSTLARLLRALADRLDPSEPATPPPIHVDIDELRDLLAASLAGLGLPHDLTAGATSDELRTLAAIAKVAEGMRRCDWVAIEHGVWPQ